MRKSWFAGFIVLAMILSFSAADAFAGAKLEINDEASLDLGFMVNTQMLSTEKDLDADGKYDGSTSFGVKRGRIRLKGKVNDTFGFMYQTEVSATTGGSGYDMRMLEAYINMNFSDWVKVMTGQVMAPVMRQNVTSTAALMAITRPNFAFKNLSWGMTGKSSMVNQGYADGASGITAPVASRDTGVILWGTGELSEDMHLKYYVGIYDGVQQAGKDAMRFTGRVQLNFLDAEPGFWNKSTYLGTKETIGIGIGYDTQSDIAFDTATGKTLDYEMITFDLFADLFITEYNPITFELGYTTLDLGGSTTGVLGSALATPFTTGAPIKQVSGTGMYTQIGYLLADVWQPWIMYENWESDATTGKGGYDAFRIGLTYYVKGHNANIKVGYSQFNADQKIGTSQEDSIGTFIVGAYLFY